MKIGLAAIVISLTAALVVVLTSASRESLISVHSPVGAVAASPSGSPQLEPGALPGPLEDTAYSQPQGGAPSPRSEPVSSEAPYAPAAADPVPAVQPADEQVAALDQLIEQSRQENEQLGQIHHQIAALRQQSADQESQRQDEAEQAAAQHAATLEALNTLRQAEALLETGNSDGVDDALVRAEAALSGRTLLDVEMAREALSRSDLLPARQYLAAALAERRVPR
jgi:hypothetical protein